MLTQVRRKAAYWRSTETRARQNAALRPFEKGGQGDSLLLSPRQPQFEEDAATAPAAAPRRSRRPTLCPAWAKYRMYR